jgi:sugar/nucleoside kinase (ribokinase family)
MSSIGRGVVGVGNALVDVLAHATDDFVLGHRLAKGAMTLVDETAAESLLGRLGPAIECSGGSAANTMVGVASLGGDAAYVGKVRDDRLGRVFSDSIRAARVSFRTPPATSGPPTGRAVVLVTPDAQRTMQTFLGASATLGPDDVDPATIQGAAIVFLEGYLWDVPAAKQAMLAAAAFAREAGRKVAFTLSDPFCVERHRDEFRQLVADHVDILFANEQEALALYRVGDLGAALARLEQECETVAVTCSARGSVVLSGGQRHAVAAVPVEHVVDTTGAGDLYAAGFLFGLLRGAGPDAAGRLGSIAAAEIISHFGARPERSLAELVHPSLA